MNDDQKVKDATRRLGPRALKIVINGQELVEGDDYTVIDREKGVFQMHTPLSNGRAYNGHLEVRVNIPQVAVVEAVEATHYVCLDRGVTCGED